jgi:hypothetical protein
MKGPISALVLALVGTALLGALSRLPWDAGRSDQAIVRLAWRTTGERIRECRRLTEAELEKIPAHMRRLEECTEREIPYRLALEIDGAGTLDALVHAAGARHDRPLYVFRESAVAPGPHRVSVQFTRAEEPPPGVEPVGETPAALDFDTTLTLLPREILLVTYDPEPRRLTIERPAPSLTALPRSGKP